MSSQYLYTNALKIVLVYIAFCHIIFPNNFDEN